MPTKVTDLLGANVTRNLLDRVQPTRIEMVKASPGVITEIPPLTPMSLDPATGLYIPWTPTTVSAIFDKLRGFVWPYAYQQETADVTFSLMTAGVVPIDEIIGNGWPTWVSSAPSPDGFYYVAFLRLMRDPALVRDTLHIIGQGDLF